MFLSIFDIFKIGVGPSSSHTFGPMVATARFLDLLRSSDFTPKAVRVSLHGSLAFTGRGHATDRAVTLGLAGFAPESYDAEKAETALERIASQGSISPEGLGELRFNPNEDIEFAYGNQLPGHTNGMVFTALDKQNDVIFQEIFYSTGGGFVATSAELDSERSRPAGPKVPFPFKNAADLLKQSRGSGLDIASLMRANELAIRSANEIDDGIESIWDAMNRCIGRGLATNGVLPGGLGVKRRACSIHEALMQERGNNLIAPHSINDWISVYAMAVNEENAAGGQIVTAPTNGAAGVVPATLKYFLDHVPTARRGQIADFLLVAAAIGGIVKRNASISGAECGCQAEVGTASAMAAAGLCAVLGGTAEQIENAAEIALEHHLGMTCDPIAGLVQIPCIERNGLGAVKAVTSASLSMRGDGKHCVPLDSCIETMRQTGKDMNDKYKETSLGGLAVNVPNC